MAQPTTPEEAQEFMENLFERIGTIIKDSGLTQDDALDPNEILDAFTAALRNTADGKKLLGIVASLLGTAIDLGQYVQQLEAIIQLLQQGGQLDIETDELEKEQQDAGIFS